MSDDTPTEAYNPNEGNAPTRRMPQQNADTPTERMGATPPRDGVPAAAPGSDAPTEYIPVAGGATSTTPPPPSFPEPGSHTGDEPPKRPRGLIITLIAIGVALIIALIVLIVMLTSNDDPAPVSTPTTSASATSTPTPTSTPTSNSPTPTPTEEPEPTATATPTPSATATAPPAAAAPVFTSFTPANDSPVPCNDAESKQPVDFSWTSTGATEAWFAAGTDDAMANPDTAVSPSGDISATFDCSQESEIFTVTLDNGEGDQTSTTITLNRALGD
jgi:hypothetical protein